MADSENARKPYHPRRNPPSRPLPGVQKAMQNFGVKDLREILDKKHQEDPQSEKQTKQNLPPPDPSYNYLKDPARDRPKPPPPKKDENKQPQERHYRSKDSSQHQRPKTEQTEHPRHYRNREHVNDNNQPPKTPPEDSLTLTKDGASKREPRSSDAPRSLDGDSHSQHFARGGRNSFRGRNSRRGHGGKPREDREEKIENPVNIKIQLSTETGRRSCTLDENTKIADLKHVPDQPSSHRSRAFRGGRGNFRGRGRGRGSYRGRGGTFNRRDNKSEESEAMTNSATKQGADKEENSNRDKDGEETNQAAERKEQTEAANNENEAKLEEYDDYDPENDEFVDTNETYELEADHHAESTGEVQVSENSPETEARAQQTPNSFDSNLAQSMTITSSKFQNGEVKRSVEVKSNGESNVTDALQEVDAQKE